MRLSIDRDRLLLAAKLGAFALFLSTIEYMIPKPVPFMRIGLANVPIMFALALLRPSGFALLVVLKVTGQALVNGTLFSYIFLFSLGGTIASAAAMFALYHLLRSHISFIGISVAGALVSNLVQLALAGVLMFGPSIRLIAPPFLVMGVASSIVLGLFVQRFSQKSQWFIDHELHDRSLDDHLLTPVDAGYLDKTDPRLVTGLVILPAFLLQPSLAATAALAIIAVIAAVSVGRKIRIVPNLLVLVSVTLANLLQVNGLVLATIGGFQVTAGALAIGLKKALTLIGLIYLSQFMVSRRPRLPGLFGYIVSLQLYYFEQITEKWRSMKRGGLIARLDTLLYRLEETGTEKASNTTGTRESAPGRTKVWLVLFVIISWLLLIPGFMDIIP
jgi:uncharacterized membrane protein